MKLEYPITDPRTLQRLRSINASALSSTPTLHHSYALAKAAMKAGVPGHLVECGVYAGSQLGAMCLAMEELNESGRKAHGFDSFSGFPKASDKDGDDWQQRLGVGLPTERSKPLDPSWGFNDKIGAELVAGNMRSWGLRPESFQLHVGWFQDTVPGWSEPIAVLRLDGDLYESTRVCLEHLYPHLSAGGVCIVDDYALPGCRKAVDEFFSGEELDVHDIDGGGGPAWWVRR